MDSCDITNTSKPGRQHLMISLQSNSYFDSKSNSYARYYRETKAEYDDAENDKSIDKASTRQPIGWTVNVENLDQNELKKPLLEGWQSINSSGKKKINSETRAQKYSKMKSKSYANLDAEIKPFTLFDSPTKKTSVSLSTLNYARTKKYQIT